jgi:hypothetical protein
MASPTKAAWLALGFIFACSARAELAPANALREAEAVCADDNSALWGFSLCGPVLLVDPATRSVFANQADAEKILRPEGEIFVGKLPEQINIANTALDWAGVRWTMIMLPLPEANDRRAVLMAHEMWHRIQGELGLAAVGATNNHLDTRDGRFWLQLEWRALTAALEATGAGRTEAACDAVVFRMRRRELFPDAARNERDLELNEGLAEYTGVKLIRPLDPVRFVVRNELKEAPLKKSFVRSFAYATGPAYGLLLDNTGADWRQAVRERRDLAELLIQRAGIRMPANIETAANERATKYGGVALGAEEDGRERAHRDLVKNYRAKLVDGPVLIVPLHKMNMQFDPGNLVSLDSLGTVYPNIRIVDDWGVLTVTKDGALMSADFTRVLVPAPKKMAQPTIEGDGWNLRLNPGWSLSPGQRKGDLIIRAD